MAQSKILITGATGANGAEIAKLLQKRAVPFRAMVRDRPGAAGLAGPKIEVVEGDFGRPETLGPALDGIERAFLLAPPHPRQTEWQNAFIDAARKAGVKHITKFSAIGTSPDSPVNFLRWHAESDRYLADSGLPFTLLRPNGFMQNFLGFAPLIQAQGAFFAPAGDCRVSFVDVRDNAAVAVAVLTQDGHAGKTYVITGPQAITQAEAADKLSAALGRTIQFMDVPPEAARQNLRGAGLTDWMADGVVALYGEYRAGKAEAVTNSVEEVGGKKPFTFEEFARDYAAAFGAEKGPEPLQALLPTCITRLTRNSTINRINRIFAMPANATAIPPNPRMPAIMAMIRKTSA